MVTPSHPQITKSFPDTTPGHPYRQLMDVLHEMPRIRRQLGLSIDKLPHFTTVCHANKRLYMPNWQRLLEFTSDLSDLGEVQATEASGFDRVAASRKYAKRTNYLFQAMKTTLLVDCSSGAILDVHFSTKKPHDTKIGQQLFARNLDRVSTITADKGYDSTEKTIHDLRNCHNLLLTNGASG